MSKPVRVILAVLAGLVIGSLVNKGLTLLSDKVIAPPEGLDAATMEGLKAGMHLMEPKHFLFPFLAHALGTLVGAFVAAKIASTSLPAYIIGALFLIGGITMAVHLPAPLWFEATDLILAYIPAAWLGQTLATGRGGSESTTAN